MAKRILIVDDELDFLHVMKRLLEIGVPYQVRTVNLPSQVVYVAREFKPDLILLDCMMLGMDGGQVAATIQADPLLKDTPFLFLTCTVSDVESAPSRCYSGVQTYVPKNMGFDELIQVIERKLAGQPLVGAGPTVA